MSVNLGVLGVIASGLCVLCCLLMVSISPWSRFSSMVYLM